MTRILLIVTLLAGVARADLVAGGAPGDTLVFAEHGFSIHPLKGKSASATQQVLTMTMPASAGFAPNVNVQVQPFDGTLDDYMKISREQFKAMGITMVQEKREGKSIILEYKGQMQGMPLHWYARAVQAQGKIFLTTGTAAESQWASVAAQIKECVGSFKALP